MESPQVAAAAQELVLDPAVPWPRCVPGAKEALEVLTGGRPLSPSLQGVTAQVRASAHPLIQRIMDGELLEFDDAVLRGAVALRWRLAVAGASAATWGGEVDAAALEALLAESDAALKTYIAPQGASPELVAAFDAERQALVRAAVQVVQQVRHAAPAVVKQVLSRAVPVTDSATRMLSNEWSSPKARSWLGGHWAWVVAGLGVALAGGLFAYSQSLRPAPLPPATGPAPGTIGSGHTPDGVQFIHSADGKPLAPELVARLKDEAAAAGRTFQQPGPGEVILGPTPVHP